MDRENNEMPDFDTPEMKRDGFNPFQPPVPGIGRGGRNEPAPKLSLQMSVPLNSEELKRLCTVASSLNMEIEMMVRQAILSFIGAGKTPTNSFFPERERRPSWTNLPPEDRESRLRTEGRGERKVVEEEERQVEQSDADGGNDMATYFRKGTGCLAATDERQFVTATDYNIIEKSWEEKDGGGWSGELITMTEIPLGEYILYLEEEDGRSGKIILSDIQETDEFGYKAYRYNFCGIGALIDEREDLR